MKSVLVIVDWLHPANGGRNGLPQGETYIAPVRFLAQSESDWQDNAWSLKFTWLDKESSSGSWFGIAEFLSPEGPAEWLEPDNHFEIYEGPEPVGKVKVLASAKVMAGIKALA
ncbi:MAG: hypothetical protein AAF741_03380 [Bacteroidota bacterium]